MRRKRRGDLSLDVPRRHVAESAEHTISAASDHEVVKAFEVMAGVPVGHVKWHTELDKALCI